jgi:RHS repeat-associated protein
MNMTYNFSATQNNGRIVSSADGVTGENVSYTYDALNRLIAAATTGTGGVQWGESYSYDGFGNLTSKVPTKGTAPQVYPQVNSATNQARMIGDYGFDANGNWLGAGGSQSNTWNVENQLISNGAVDGSGNLLTYTYDPWGKRVLQYSVHAAGSQGSGTLYFYGISGQRLGSYQLNDYPPAYGGIIALTPMYIPQYFGKRMLVAMDRLGSVRNSQNGSMAYYPWGEERTTTPDGTDKFATYFRDGVTDGVGQDYAKARYYNNNFGRFWSPDPKGFKAANPKNPASWNRYAYVNGDPVNGIDPTGRIIKAPPDPGSAGGGDDGDYCLAVGDEDSIVDPCFGFTWASAGSLTEAPNGGGSSPQVWVSTLGSPTAAQIATLQAAFNDAMTRLSTPQCGGLFEGDALPSKLATTFADSALESTEYSIFAYPGVSTAVTISASQVGINPNGWFFAAPNSAANPGMVAIGVPSPTTPGQSSTVYLSPADLGAMILLHELGHETGVFGEDENNLQVNGQHTWAVLQSCFGMQAPQ